MTTPKPRSKGPASARRLGTPLLVALSVPAMLASAASARAQPVQSQPADVGGGASFLSGSLTAGTAAVPSLDMPGQNGFIMKDTIIIRTGGW